MLWGTPSLLEIMGLEHPNDPLIHGLQQRRSVGQQKKKKKEKEKKNYITMQVLQYLGVGGAVVEDHQDMEGKVVSHAVLLQLGYQGTLAVCLENRASHPASCTGVPMNGQPAPFITLN